MSEPSTAWGLTGTYDERLVEGEHDDQLDRQEFCEGFLAFQLFFGKSIEDEETVECDSTDQGEQCTGQEIREQLTLY